VPGTQVSGARNLESRSTGAAGGRPIPSNYARLGFAAHIIRFANTVTVGEGKPLRTVLGGTGLAISAHCANVGRAMGYLIYVASGECQRTLYGLSGGQPAHR